MGEATFGVLLFQDLAVIPLFAALPLLAVGAAHGATAAASGHDASLISGLPGWLRALAVIGAVTAVGVGGRFLVRPIFRFIAAARLREIFTAAALLIVVGVAMDTVNQIEAQLIMRHYEGFTPRAGRIRGRRSVF